MLTMALVATTAAAGATAAVAAPSGALADPKPGDACTSADLGKRFPVIKSATVEPTVTHFKAYFVTAGTTGSQAITLNTQTVITVMVGSTTQIQANFTFNTLFGVQAFTNRVVQKTTATTNSETQVITWNFLQPGYYGVYQGTRKVTGEYGSLNCNRVDLGNGQYATRWVERPGGSYTTFTEIEEGVVRCEDAVPANSIMKKAQDRLGCEAAVTAKATDKPAPTRTVPAKVTPAASTKSTADANRVAAVPPGFTCDSGWYRIGTADRRLFWWNIDGTDDIRLGGWTNSSRTQWALCRGPVSNGMTESVLITRYSGKCLTAWSDTVVEGGPLREGDCQVSNDRQRFYIYEDVPGTNLVGIQIKGNGYMIGQDSVTDNEGILQFSVGMQDGTGTYAMEKIA